MPTGCFDAEDIKNRHVWETVVHEQSKFSFKYPKKWEMALYEEKGDRGYKPVRVRINNKVSPIFSDDPRVFISIDQRYFPSPTLADAELWANERLDRSPGKDGLPYGYEEFLNQEEILDSQVVLRKRCTYFNAGGAVIEKVFIPREYDVLIITLRANEEIFDEAYPDFNRIINSFHTID